MPWADSLRERPWHPSAPCELRQGDARCFRCTLLASSRRDLRCQAETWASAAAPGIMGRALPLAGCLRHSCSASAGQRRRTLPCRAHRDQLFVATKRGRRPASSGGRERARGRVCSSTTTHSCRPSSTNATSDESCLRGVPASRGSRRASHMDPVGARWPCAGAVPNWVARGCCCRGACVTPDESAALRG